MSVLCSLLFNVHSEWIFRETVEEVEKGDSVNGICVDNIRYAEIQWCLRIV